MLVALFDGSNRSFRVNVYSMVSKTEITIVSRNVRNKGKCRKGGLLQVLLPRRAVVALFGRRRKRRKRTRRKTLGGTVVSLPHSFRFHRGSSRDIMITIAINTTATTILMMKFMYMSMAVSTSIDRMEKRRSSFICDLVRGRKRRLRRRYEDERTGGLLQGDGDGRDKC